jgi:predicted phage terminase large subunit-like protein
LIRREWLQPYYRVPDRTYRSRVIQSWDTAGKTGAQNSWSACVTLQLEDDKLFYVLDVTRGRYEYPLLRETALALADRFRPDSILIEDASTGIALAQELRDAHRYGVEAISVHHDKIARLYVQQGKFAAGCVLFPSNASFMPVFEAELLTFPQGKTTDQVDALTQGLAYGWSGYDTSYAGFQD